MIHESAVEDPLNPPCTSAEQQLRYFLQARRTWRASQKIEVCIEHRHFEHRSHSATAATPLPAETAHRQSALASFQAPQQLEQCLRQTLPQASRRVEAQDRLRLAERRGLVGRGLGA